MKTNLLLWRSGVITVVLFLAVGLGVVLNQCVIFPLRLMGCVEDGSRVASQIERYKERKKRTPHKLEDLDLGVSPGRNKWVYDRIDEQRYSLSRAIGNFRPYTIEYYGGDLRHPAHWWLSDEASSRNIESDGSVAAR